MSQGHRLSAALLTEDEPLALTAEINPVRSELKPNTVDEGNSITRALVEAANHMRAAQENGRAQLILTRGNPRSEAPGEQAHTLKVVRTYIEGVMEALVQEGESFSIHELKPIPHSNNFCVTLTRTKV